MHRSIRISPVSPAKWFKGVKDIFTDLDRCRGTKWWKSSSQSLDGNVDAFARMISTHSLELCHHVPCSASHSRDLLIGRWREQERERMYLNTKISTCNSMILRPLSRFPRHVILASTSPFIRSLNYITALWFIHASATPYIPFVFKTGKTFWCTKSQYSLNPIDRFSLVSFERDSLGPSCSFPEDLLIAPEPRPLHSC